MSLHIWQVAATEPEQETRVLLAIFQGVTRITYKEFFNL